ncbi:MAG: hypothetical protein WDO15_19835 [Bacteroidota bacterium]
MKQREFTIDNIPLTSEMFVNVTRGLRMLTLKYRDSYSLNEDDYTTLQKHQEHFTQILIKAISRTNKQII